MSEYIERRVLLERIRATGYDDLVKSNLLAMVVTIPAADVRPVVKGRWVRIGSSDMVIGEANECSVCHKMRYGRYKPNFCANCGADMRSLEFISPQGSEDAMLPVEVSRDSGNEEMSILSAAIAKYGEQSQIMMAFEEMAELQKELCKNRRGKDNIEEIADEVADVEIMLQQLKMIYGIANTVQQHRRFKLERLAYRLEGKQEQSGIEVNKR